ncbi:MAG: hypothetical protein H6739_33645 [Alphaproteobacteria bacterium]|nr:hypothetical protein [Alphaproteobacteria bacterium]
MRASMITLSLLTTLSLEARAAGFDEVEVSAIGEDPTVESCSVFGLGVQPAVDTWCGLAPKDAAEALGHEVVFGFTYEGNPSVLALSDEGEVLIFGFTYEGNPSLTSLGFTYEGNPS